MKTVALCLAALSLAAATLAALWTQRYRYDRAREGGETVVVRTDRFTSRSEILRPRHGWVDARKLNADLEPISPLEAVLAARPKLRTAIEIEILAMEAATTESTVPMGERMNDLIIAGKAANAANDTEFDYADLRKVVEAQMRWEKQARAKQ